MKLNLEYNKKCHRKEIVRELQTLIATHHMLHVSPLREDIAEAVGIPVEKLDRLTQKRIWGDALTFWTAGGTRSRMPKHEIETELTGDMRQTQKLWNDMFAELPIQDLQKFEHRKLRDKGNPEVVWDVDDLKKVNRARRMLHRCVALGFHVLFLITFWEVF